MKRILIVDDHVVVRDGVKRICAEQEATTCFGEAANGAAGLRLVEEQEWDIVVLDLSLDGRNGLELLKQLKEIRPKLPVVILSMHSEEQYARRAFKAGASGYIAKDSPRAELLIAINKIMAGGKYLSVSLAERLIVNLEGSTDGLPHQSLSDREFEVMCLIASGKAVSEIASLLSLSVKTISTHRAHILEKLEMTTNADLTRYALHGGLIG